MIKINLAQPKINTKPKPVDWVRVRAAIKRWLHRKDCWDVGNWHKCLSGLLLAIGFGGAAIYGPGFLLLCVLLVFAGLVWYAFAGLISMWLGD